MSLKALATSGKTYLSILSAYRLGRSRLPYLPVLFWVEPTNQCNLSCVMCANAQLPDKKTARMELSTFRHLVDQISARYPADVATLALFLGGEPLLHRDLFEMIRYARERRVKVNLATNGTLLTKKATDALLSCPPSLLILSFDGYDQASYERARRGARFDRVLGNIMALLDEKRRRKLERPLVRLYSLILDRANEATERARFGAFFEKQFAGMGVNEFLVEPAGGGGWPGDLAAEGAVAPHPSFHPCARIWYSMSVHADGTVVACCSDFTGQIKLGNVKQKGLFEIWNDTPYRTLREQMLARRTEGLPPSCRRCDAVYPSDAALGIPGELLIHRKAVRDLKSRVRAATVR